MKSWLIKPKVFGGLRMSDSTQPQGMTAGDDTSGLLQPHLVTRELRNVVEAELIDRAYDKFVFRARRKSSAGEWLTDLFIRSVHDEMFGELWAWAGKYRTSDLNLGVSWHAVPEQIQQLCGNFVYWNSSEASMQPIEVAARLQHTLTKIHPFTNGNGRHARLLTDIFFHSKKISLPFWPQIQRLPQGDSIRSRYIAAMKSADNGDIEPLKLFIADHMTEKKPE